MMHKGQKLLNPSILGYYLVITWLLLGYYLVTTCPQITLCQQVRCIFGAFFWT